MEPISTLRNICIMAIVLDIGIQDNKFTRPFNAIAADSMGLFLYKDYPGIVDTVSAWKEVVALDAPVLSGMLNFPNGKELAYDNNHTVYLSIAWGVLIPERENCLKNYYRTTFDNANYWLARYHRSIELYRVYDLMDDLYRDIPLWKKRLKLGQIRDAIGIDAYNSGVLPWIVD